MVAVVMVAGASFLGLGLVSSKSVSQPAAPVYHGVCTPGTSC